jgi:hypothetical protein
LLTGPHGLLAPGSGHFLFYCRVDAKETLSPELPHISGFLFHSSE